MAKHFYLTGPDGSGKTSFLKEIENHFSKIGIKTESIWLRSPKILSKPLMAYCRLVGLTKYKTIKRIKYGGHEFYRSKFVSWLFPWLQLIDFRIKLFVNRRIMASNKIILIDRFSLDTLADLMADTERYDLHKTYVGRSLVKLIPTETKIIVLNTEEKNIQARKTDTLHDPILHKKIKAYNILFKDLKLDAVDNNRDFQTVKKDIFKKLSL